MIIIILVAGLPAPAHFASEEPSMLKEILEGIQQVNVELMNSRKAMEIGLTDLNAKIVDMKEEIKIVKRAVKNLIADNLVSSSQVKLGISTVSELNDVEEALKDETERKNLVAKLSTIGSSQPRAVVNNMVNAAISRELAVTFSLQGRTNKRALVSKELFIQHSYM